MLERVQGRRETRFPGEGATLKPRRFQSWASIAGLALLASCGLSEQTPKPQAPGLYNLRGRVVLVGYLVSPQGVFADTRVVQDADGVPVELLSGDRVLARTTTVGGRYSFSGVAPGGYQTETKVVGRIDSKSRPLIVVASDLEAGDTLRLVSYGDLFPVPNPFDTETFVYFALPDSERFEIYVMTLSGDTVRVLLNATRPKGLNQVRWDGTSQLGAQMPAGPYWVIFRSGPDERGQLLFKESAVATTLRSRAYRRTPRAGRTARRRSRSRTTARR
jgi:hypothetical protein